MGLSGALLPLSKRADVDFFTHLEMFLRQEQPPLSGRDHLTFSSAYVPVKAVLDGDLCERFATMDSDKQHSVASELDGRTPAEVAKKLDDTRNRIM
jgi:splicing factor 3B subunit 3